MIYFDHNATSPLCPAAREAWLTSTERFIGNPSSPHRLGSRAEVALSAARQQAAAYLGCSEFDIVWTSGATEANNAIFFNAARSFDGPVFISGIEHPSVIAAANHWFPGRVSLLKVNNQGAVDLNDLTERLKQSRPVLVGLMAANNETGVLQPWEEAWRLCREKEIPFFSDAAQWIGKEAATGVGSCDFVTGCAHKFGGPLGIGFFKAPSSIRPLIVGGPQEEGRRAGTENVHGALAMMAAWADRENKIASGEIERRVQWRDRFIEGLQKSLPEIEVLGLNSPRLWNTVAALMPPSPDCRRRWVVQLDKLGFAVSTGSACASGKEKPSHVLTAMGCDPAKADRMLRFSSGWETPEEDWGKLLEAIKAAYSELT